MEIGEGHGGCTRYIRHTPISLMLQGNLIPLVAIKGRLIEGIEPDRKALMTGFFRSTAGALLPFNHNNNHMGECE